MRMCCIAFRAAFWPSSVGIEDFDASLAALTLFLSVADNTTIFAQVRHSHDCLPSNPS